MRAANFQVEGSIYLQQGGLDFDLHNDYDFSGFSYSVAERVVELSWIRSPGDCVRRDMPTRLVLSCRGVTHVSATGRDPFSGGQSLLSTLLKRVDIAGIPDEAAFQVARVSIVSFDPYAFRTGAAT